MSDQTKLLMLYLRVGMSVLSARVVLLLAMMLAFALFSWAMYLPGWERISAATIFTVLVFIPATRIDASVAKERAVVSPQAPE